jgi:LysR family transcriptional activator of nhaA
MEWLNYHHLLYFWTVAREGGVARAAARLRLAHPTVSAQVKLLERALGEPLFRRAGRRLELTGLGRVAYRYADEIFGLGRELLDTVRGRPTGRPVRLSAGVSDVLPKAVAHRLLAPLFALPEPLRLTCREGKTEALLAALGQHELDLVLADAPVPPGSPVRAASHALGECAVDVLAAPRLAARHRKGFPRSLDGAPMLLPAEGTALRRALDAWLERHALHPRVVGEFEDSALLTVFGADGLGLFPVPEVASDEAVERHGVARVGRLPEVRERFWVLTLERRVQNPAVAALRDAARERLFAPSRRRAR